MQVIGLTGAAGAGKDTTAQFALEWCKENGLAAKRRAFADALKTSAAACFGVPADKAIEFCDWLKRPGVFVTAEELEGGGGAQTRVSGRRFLQFYGTEGHRDVFGSEFWVDIMESFLEEDGVLGVDVVFLSDPRFENEADMIRHHDGQLWHIERTAAPAVEPHASEDGLILSRNDSVIANVGDLQDLRTMVHSLCEQKIGAAS